MPCGCLGPVATRRPLEPRNASSRSAVTPVSTGYTGRISPPPELSLVLTGLLRRGVTNRALASPGSAKAPHLRGFRHAPKRTRTSTRESPDKALNLARLPIPPPAQVGQPGHIGRWRWPSIAPSGAAARLRRAPARRRAGARSRPRGPPARRAPRRHRAPPWRWRARPCPPPRRRSRRRPRCPSRSPSRSR